jgi:hypothetical protein
MRRSQQPHAQVQLLMMLLLLTDLHQSLVHCLLLQLLVLVLVLLVLVLLHSHTAVQAIAASRRYPLPDPPHGCSRYSCTQQALTAVAAGLHWLPACTPAASCSRCPGAL